MNWEIAGALGEVIGALAVVVSLAYLSIQIRANTRAKRGSAGFEATHSIALTNERILELDQDVKSAVIRSYQPSCAWEDFTPEQRFDIGLVHRALLQKV